jgi:hypothetical protein
VSRIENGFYSASEPQFMTYEGSKRLTKVNISERTGKIVAKQRDVLLYQGLSPKWTAEQVELQRRTQFNPILDVENMAKRYKLIAESLFNSEMLYENSEECYPNGEPMKRVNINNFKIMEKCDKMYMDGLKFKPGLSVYTNRTTAVNMGVKTFTEHSIDVDSKEVVEEVCQHLAGRGKTATKKVISKQSTSYNAGSSLIGQTSATGRKENALTVNTSNAAKRRRTGLPPGKEGGYVQNKAINQFE